MKINELLLCILKWMNLKNLRNMLSERSRLPRKSAMYPVCKTLSLVYITKKYWWGIHIYAIKLLERQRMIKHSFFQESSYFCSERNQGDRMWKSPHMDSTNWKSSSF